MRSVYNVIGDVQIQEYPNGELFMINGVERVEFSRADSPRRTPTIRTNSGEAIRAQAAYVPPLSTQLSFDPWTNQFDSNKKYLVAFKTERGNAEAIGLFGSSGIFIAEKLDIGLNPGTQERFNPN